MSCCSPKKEDDHHHEKKQGGGCCSAPKQEKQSGCCSPERKTSISKDMTIEEILGMFPFKAQRLSQEITNAGLHCVGCHAAVWETLEGGMLGHGKSYAEIEELVKRLNALLQEEVNLDSISVTPRAAAKLIEIAKEEDKEGWALRFAEEMAGCNGFEYVLDFSKEADAEDQVFESNGIAIHVKKKMLPRLMGSEIDYVEGLRGAGFKISNPNARSSCGCGSSHNY